MGIFFVLYLSNLYDLSFKPCKKFPTRLLDLKNKVLSQNFDFGVAFDGDADRSVFVDDKGNVISGSMMTCLISDWLFEKKSEIKIVHNVNVQPSVIEYLKNKGIKTIRSKVGHSYIKKNYER